MFIVFDVFLLTVLFFRFVLLFFTLPFLDLIMTISDLTGLNIIPWNHNFSKTSQIVLCDFFFISLKNNKSKTFWC